MSVTKGLDSATEKKDEGVNVDVEAPPNAEVESYPVEPLVGNSVKEKEASVVDCEKEVNSVKS